MLGADPRIGGGGVRWGGIGPARGSGRGDGVCRAAGSADVQSGRGGRGEAAGVRRLEHRGDGDCPGCRGCRANAPGDWNSPIFQDAVAFEARTNLTQTAYLRGQVGPATPPEIAVPIHDYLVATFDQEDATMRRMNSQRDAAIDTVECGNGQGRCRLRLEVDLQRRERGMADVTTGGPYAHLIVTPDMVPPDPEPLEAAAAHHRAVADQLDDLYQQAISVNAQREDAEQSAGFEVGHQVNREYAADISRGASWHRGAAELYSGIARGVPRCHRHTCEHSHDCTSGDRSG